MIRVLQVGLGPNPGGIENCIMNHYRHLNREDFQFDFADIYGQGLAYEAEIKELGGEIKTCVNFKKNPLRFYRQFCGLIKEEQYDLIHIHLLSAANILPVLAACKGNKKAVIVHSHNSGIPAGVIRKLLHTCNLPILRRITSNQWACGNQAGLWMWGDNFLSQDIIYNAIDVTKYHRDDAKRAFLRKQIGIKEEEILLGFVGRLEEQKNPLFLMGILYQLVRMKPEVKLIILGDGSLKDKMKETAKKLSVEDKVIFLGVRSDVCQWYSAMDYFLLPSLFEGLPVVAIEAQACGVKCFLSNHITKEADVSGEVTFLPVDKGEEIWAKAIIEAKSSMEVQPSVKREYQILYGVKQLEEKYRQLV